MNKQSGNPTISDLARTDRDRPSLRPLMILEICKYGGAVIVLYVVTMFSLSFLGAYLRDAAGFLSWLFDPQASIPADSAVKDLAVKDSAAEID